MTTPATAATKLLSNKWFWIILVVLIIALVLWKNGPRWLQQLKAQDRGNYAGQESVASNPQREAELQSLARDIYGAVSGLPSWNDTRPELFERALGMNDTELRFVAKYYATISEDNESLADAVTGEYVVGDSAERLAGRLRNMNL